MYSDLISHIRNCVELDEDSVSAVCHHFEVLRLENKDFLCREGEVCRSLYFVKKGCLRMFFYNEKGVEQITQFAIENWWLTDFSSFMSGQASGFNIQAIEFSEVLAIDAVSYGRLLGEVPALNRYFCTMAQRAVAASQVRLKLIFSLSKEDMYMHFNSTFPDFVQRIPQYMLASFLNITPEYLSGLRKRS